MRAKAVLVAWACALGGCAGRQDLVPDPARAADVPLPSYEMLYAGAEERIGALDRLWAAAVTSLRYTDDRGERHRDQGEGHFQMVRPDSLALFVGKLGDVLLVLGSDADRYWWIERLEQRRAYVGRQDDAATLAAEAVGVPVLPGDLLLALDLLPWPAPGAGGGEVAWSSHPGLDPARTLAVTMRQGPRERRVHVDLFTFDPMAVELLTEEGETVATSRLSRHERVRNATGAARTPRIPLRAEVDIPAADARLELTLSRAELSASRPKPQVFDLEHLLRAFGVNEVIELGTDRARADAGL